MSSSVINAMNIGAAPDSLMVACSGTLALEFFDGKELSSNLGSVMSILVGK